LKLVGRVPRAALVGGEFDVLVALVDGAPFAIEDACNHAGASLVDGTRHGDRVACPMHGYIFSLRTGELLEPRRLCDAQRTFVTTEEGDDVIVWDAFSVAVWNPGA